MNQRLPGMNEKKEKPLNNSPLGDGGKNINIAVIEGDGIGPEVTRQSVKVLNAIAEQFGHEFSYQYCLLGADAIDKTGTPLPQ